MIDMVIQVNPVAGLGIHERRQIWEELRTEKKMGEEKESVN